LRTIVRGSPRGARGGLRDESFHGRRNSGNGLHIVEGIAEIHNWEITVTKSVDGGARFEIQGCNFVDG